MTSKRPLEGQRVLIVGGLQRLSHFYRSEVLKFGAKKVEWRHHHRKQLGGRKKKPDLLIFIRSHNTRQSSDRAEEVSAARTIYVVKHQRSSFADAVLEKLRKS